jgi:hypothetical protein
MSNTLSNNDANETPQTDPIIQKLVQNHVLNQQNKQKQLETTETVETTDELDVVDIINIVNPFFVSTQNEGMKMEDIYDNYESVYVLCLKNDRDTNGHLDMTHLNRRNVTLDILKSYRDHLTLVEAPLRLLKNPIHKRSMVIVNQEHLALFNHYGYDMNIDEIVIMIPELTEQKLHEYVKLYEGPFKLSDVISAKVLYNYFNCVTYRYVVQKNMSKIVQNISETDYWSDSYNCQLNMNEPFMNRRFKYFEPLNDKIKAITNTRKDEDTKLFTKLTNIDLDKTNYLQFIYRKDVYVDASVAAKSEKRRLYTVENDLEENTNINTVTKNQVTEWFDMIIDKKERYDLFNALLISKKYTHLVVNNQHVLDIMKPTINKYMPLYRYLFGYAWLTLYMEECIVKTRTDVNRRYVFDLDTASKLPVFPYCPEDPHLNPYISMLVSKDLLNSKNNCGGVKPISEYDHYGLNDFEGFIRNFNIFTTGNQTRDLFENVDWTNMAVSGSIMTACTPKRNPLMSVVVNGNNNNNPTEPQMNRFFNEYYANSDVDIMINNKNVFDFMDTTEKLVNQITVNLGKMHNRDVSKNVHTTSIKSLNMVVNIKVLSHIMQEYTLDYIIEHISDNVIKGEFYQMYFTKKFESNRAYRKQTNKTSPLYEEFYKIVNIDDMNIILVDYDIYEERDNDGVGIGGTNECEMYMKLSELDKTYNPASKNGYDPVMIKIGENVKFKVSSPFMEHNLEIFKIKYDDFFSTVAKFHLPCVRAFYNGTTVKCLPSFITAMMTFMNVDYKYFAGVRTPTDIINKYRTRGFGIFINDREKMCMAQYNAEAEKWKSMMNLNTKSKQSIEKHFGYLEMNSNMFTPGVFFNGLSATDDYSANRNHNYDYVETIQHLEDEYKIRYNYDNKKSCIDFLKLRTIQENGYVAPLQKWAIDAAYNTLK